MLWSFFEVRSILLWCDVFRSFYFIENTFYCSMYSNTICVSYHCGSDARCVLSRFQSRSVRINSMHINLCEVTNKKKSRSGDSNSNSTDHRKQLRGRDTSPKRDFFTMMEKITSIRFQWVMILNLKSVFDGWNLHCFIYLQRKTTIDRFCFIAHTIGKSMHVKDQNEGAKIHYINCGNEESYHFICPSAHAQQQQHHWFSTSAITLK